VDVARDAEIFDHGSPADHAEEAFTTDRGEKRRFRWIIRDDVADIQTSDGVSVAVV